MWLNVDQEMIGCAFIEGSAPALEQIRTNQCQQQQDGKPETEGNHLYGARAAAACDICKAITPGNANARAKISHCGDKAATDEVQGPGDHDDAAKHDCEHFRITNRTIKQRRDGRQ